MLQLMKAATSLKDLAKREAIGRLAKINRRMDALAAEKAMLEQFLASGEMQSFRRSTTLRTNSVRRWSLQGRVTAFLREKKEPVKAAVILDMLRQHDAGLKPATFRSHIKRLAEAGVIEREGARGFYQLTRRIDDEEYGERPIRPRRPTTIRPPSVYERNR